MSLSGALQIGRSGLLANQAAIEVAGHNLANVATRGYHRQTIALAPAGSQEIQQGVFIGRGVQIQEITRQVSQALEQRIRDGLSDESAATVRQQFLDQIEALEQEFSDNSLSTQLGVFFGTWSALANSPGDNSLRSMVIQQGSSLASLVRNLRSNLTDLRTQTDQSIDGAALAANDLLTQIADLNQAIVRSGGATSGGGGDAGLLDQRDQLLGELAKYMDISIAQADSGSVDVFVGSTPVILDGRSRGVEVRRETQGDELAIQLVLSADGSVLTPGSGQLGALIATRSEDVNGAIEALDQFAAALIYQVNRVHSQGQGLSGLGEVASTQKVLDADAALNSEAAGLAFDVTHGSFQISVRQKFTGLVNSSTIRVDLDGINPAGDTTLSSLVDSINAAVGNVTASVTPDNRLHLATNSGDYEIYFSDDTSGVLAALGVNGFFQGSSAQDVAVASAVAASPDLVAARQGLVAGDNRNALALAGLGTAALDDLGGLSLADLWQRHVEDYAVRLGQAQQQVEATAVVRDNLLAQQQQVSGVNTDEETINLLAFQRAYQASARFLNVVDEMMQTLLQLV